MFLFSTVSECKLQEMNLIFVPYAQRRETSVLKENQLNFDIHSDYLAKIGSVKPLEEPLGFSKPSLR